MSSDVVLIASTSVSVPNTVSVKGKPKPPVRPPNLASCEEYRPLLSKYDWDVEIMLRIMKQESTCRSWIVNNNPSTGDYSVGLFQVNLFGNLKKDRPSEEELKVPENNIAYAYKLYAEKKNYNPWKGTCRKVGCK